MSLTKKILNFAIKRMNLIDAGSILTVVSIVALISCMFFYSHRFGPNALDDNIPLTIWLTILGMIIGMIWFITGIIGSSFKYILIKIHSRIN